MRNFLPPHTSFWKCAAFFLLLIQLTLLCWKMDRPWTYNDDYNGAFWSQAAYNLHRAGLLATAGVPAPLYFGPLPIPVESLYVHHPTLLPLLATADRALLGPSEKAARALPILFSLLTSILFWHVTRAAFSSRAAFLALALFIAAPMELHYGQMVNFEAPELFFLLAALTALYHFRVTSSAGASRTRWALLFLLSTFLALWDDWIAYLFTIVLSAALLRTRRRAETRLAFALLLLAFISGLAFLLQIRAAVPAAWPELLRAFRQRSGHADLSGVSFTLLQWARTQLTYLATLFHPLAWLLALAGLIWTLFSWRGLSTRQRFLPLAALLLLIINATYIGLLRNQSFIHDFAGFYLLLPVAWFGAFFLEKLAGTFAPPAAPRSLLLASALLLLPVTYLLYSGFRALAGIDTQFCILSGGEIPEPPLLMPHLGALLDHAFPPNTFLFTNFDPYYSPLPFYAQRTIANNLRTYPEWQAALPDAGAQPPGGVIWEGEPLAPALLRQFAPSDLRHIVVDGVPFSLWQPARAVSPP